MRRRSLAPFVLLGSVAASACGGVPFGEAPAEDGGGAEDTGPDTSAPSGARDAGQPADATTDAPTETVEAAADARPDDATIDAGLPADASTPADVGVDTGIVCPSSQKLCGGSCVPLTSPTTGCAAASCAQCSLPNGTNVCGPAGACAISSCNSGFQLCTLAGVATCVGPDAVHGVFVSPSGVTSACGSIGAPCGTIGAGITAALGGGKTIVYLDKGTYAEEVSLAEGITLEGGWTYAGDGVWSDAECTTTADPSTLAVVQPTSGSISVAASGVTAALHTLTVKSPPGAPSGGQSLYGVFAIGATHLTMNAVEISVGAGGAGLAGGVGAAPNNGQTSCSIPPLDGDPGALPAPIKNPIAGGTYASAGYTPAAGPPGSPGNPGDNGSAGGPGGSAPSASCNQASGTCVAGPNVKGNAGTGGCGGPGGAPGLGGGGGGSSIALYVWGATVSVTGGTLVSGNGGNGGAGGSGAAAASSWTGMNGGVGAPSSVPECVSKIIGGVLGCTDQTGTKAIGGSAGGPAGMGSTGGAGASGSGGDSFAYYVGGGGSIGLSGVTAACGSPGTSPGPIAGVSGSNGAGSCHD